MKNFRTHAQAISDRDRIQVYIDLIENYKPNNLKEHIIYTYALLGNLQKTADVINDHDHLLDGSILLKEDISRVIQQRSSKDDALHKMVRTLFLKKTRSARTL